MKFKDLSLGCSVYVPYEGSYVPTLVTGATVVNGVLFVGVG